ncbi:MAG: winged helix-turn-helix domain-containing protein [Proteobacteria bacterium]|nr:winged helix-turn-helix domain-containing protein [Pseudomonadota bacterium]
MQRQLLVDGVPMPVGARAFDVLLALMARPGDLVSREALLDAVWMGRVVEDNNLVVQIGALRKALGKEAIATIPGRGYRFCLPVSAPDPAPEVAGIPVGEPSQRGERPLIGRDEDVAAIGRLLDAERLVTISGAGGIGKTRIAECLCSAQRSRHAHGAVWVEIAGIGHSDLLPGSIAGAAGLSVAAGGDALRNLIAALSPLDLLLVLDNAEHLIAGVAPIVTALIAGAPRLRVLVTSQVPLRAAEEAVYRLPGLSIAEADAPLDHAMRHGAVALFVERARAQGCSAAIDAAALPSIVAICGALDGMPLAIELAAARVPMFGVHALAAHLGDRLDLLTRGRHDAPERQRTLRAALSWSYSLLEPREAQLFRRLAVFAGVFTLGMARRVGSDVDDDADCRRGGSVVDALGGLIERSLVNVDAADEPRYRLPESARCFAAQMLAASGEAEQVERRHADAVLERFSTIYGASRDGEITADRALAALEPHLDGARSALEWMMQHGDATGAITLAPALSFALTLSRHKERAQVWETTARCIDAHVPPDLRARWALGYCVYWFQRRPEVAVRWAEEALAVLQEPVWRYRALATLAMALARLGDVQRCASTCAAMDAIEDPAWHARTRFAGAMATWQLETARGDFDAALAANRRAHRLAVACGDDANVESLLVSLVDTELATGRIDDAVKHGLELERRLVRGRHVQALTVNRINLVGALVAQGQLEEARKMAAAAWPLAVAFEVHPILADNLALLAASCGDWTAAATLHGYADAARAAADMKREANECRAIEGAERLARPRLGDAYGREFAAGARLGRDEVPVVAGIATT